NRAGTQVATFDTITSSAQYVQITDLTPGPIYTQVDSKQSVTVHTGLGMVADRILATSGHGLNLEGNSPNTYVYVGNNGSLDRILGREITISNRNGSAGGVDIDDHNRGGTRTATFDTVTSDAQYEQLTDLTSGPIYTQRDDTQDLTVHTGSGMVTVRVL